VKKTRSASPAGHQASSRSSATGKRRAEILAAALDCFVTIGYAKATMEDIRSRAGASTGSIYHHFKSKEQLAAELYCEAVKATQSVGLAAIRDQGNAGTGVRRLVSAYLEWVSENPRLATYLLTMRHPEFMASSSAVVDRMNETFAKTLRDWLEGHVRTGALPALEYDVYRAILFGPSELFARFWLAGRTTTDLKQAGRLMAECAWSALESMRAK